MSPKRRENGAIEALGHFLDHMESLYGDCTLTSVSQTEMTEELLKYLWLRGYKVAPLEQEDFDAN